MWTFGREERMEAAASMFIRNPDKARLDTGKGRLRLSPIFKWYESDFPASADATEATMTYGESTGVVQLVMRHLPEEQARFIESRRPPIDYLDCDWRLDEAR